MPANHKIYISTLIFGLFLFSSTAWAAEQEDKYKTDKVEAATEKKKKRDYASEFDKKLYVIRLRLNRKLSDQENSIFYYIQDFARRIDKKKSDNYKKMSNNPAFESFLLQGIQENGSYYKEFRHFLEEEKIEYDQKLVNTICEIVCNTSEKRRANLYQPCAIDQYKLRNCIQSLLYKGQEPTAPGYDREVYRVMEILSCFFSDDQQEEENKQAPKDPLFTKKFFDVITKNNYQLIKLIYTIHFGKENYDELFVEGALQRLLGKIREQGLENKLNAMDINSKVYSELSDEEVVLVPASLKTKNTSLYQKGPINPHGVKSHKQSVVGQDKELTALEDEEKIDRVTQILSQFLKDELLKGRDNLASINTFFDLIKKDNYQLIKLLYHSTFGEENYDEIFAEEALQRLHSKIKIKEFIKRLDSIKSRLWGIISTKEYNTLCSIIEVAEQIACQEKKNSGYKKMLRDSTFENIFFQEIKNGCFTQLLQDLLRQRGGEYDQITIETIEKLIRNPSESKPSALYEKFTMKKLGLERCILSFLDSNKPPSQIDCIMQVLYSILQNHQYQRFLFPDFSDPSFTKIFFHEITKNNYNLIKATYNDLIYNDMIRRRKYDELFVKVALQRLCAKVSEEEKKPDKDVIKLALYAATKEEVQDALKQIHLTLQKGYTSDLYRKSSMKHRWKSEDELLGVLIDMVSDPENKVFSAKGKNYGKQFIYELKTRKKINKFYNKKGAFVNFLNEASFQRLLYKIHIRLKYPKNPLLVNAALFEAFNMLFWSVGELHDKFDKEAVKWYIERMKESESSLEFTAFTLELYRCFSYYEKGKFSSIAQLIKRLEVLKKNILGKSDAYSKDSMETIDQWIKKLKATPDHQTIYYFVHELENFKKTGNTNHSNSRLIMRGKEKLSKEVKEYDKACYDCFNHYKNRNDSSIAQVRAALKKLKKQLPKSNPNLLPNLDWINFWIGKLATPEEAISDFIAEKKRFNMSLIVMENSTNPLTPTNIRYEKTLNFPFNYKEEKSKEVIQTIACNFVYDCKPFDAMLPDMKGLLQKMDNLLNEAKELGVCQKKDVEPYLIYTRIRNYLIKGLQSNCDTLDPLRDLIKRLEQDRHIRNSSKSIREMATLNKMVVINYPPFEKNSQAALSDFFVIHEELYNWDKKYQKALQRGFKGFSIVGLVGYSHHACLEDAFAAYLASLSTETYHDDLNSINENPSNNNTEVFIGCPNDNQPSLTK